MIEISKITAIDIPDLWFQAIYNILSEGKRYVVHRGSFEGEHRLEFDYFIGHILKPYNEPLIPKIPPQFNIPDPVTEEYMYDYLEYFITDTKKENEAYTYGERLTNVNFSSGIKSQIDEAIRVYKQHGYENNQMVLQIAKLTDMELSDPPCLRHIDTKIRDNTLHFFVYFRSWDLWSGLPANLAAIQTLKKYMADEIGVKDGEMIVESKGLHIYGYAEQLARIRCGRNVKEIK